MQTTQSCDASSVRRCCRCIVAHTIFASEAGSPGWSNFSGSPAGQLCKCDTARVNFETLPTKSRLHNTEAQRLLAESPRPGKRRSFTGRGTPASVRLEPLRGGWRQGWGRGLAWHGLGVQAAAAWSRVLDTLEQARLRSAEDARSFRCAR